MQADQAREIVETVMSAWDWPMTDGQQDLWLGFLVELKDAEVAELAVIELFKGWPRQKGRPQPGDVRAQYLAVLRRADPEPRPQLPEPIIPLGTPPELRELVAGIRQRGVRGPEVVREILRMRGVDAPRDPQHGDVWDPPLSIIELRHRAHLAIDAKVPGCRFCGVPSDEKEGNREATA